MQAFDAGCHGGIFLGQAVVDVATMLQEGQLHATASLTSSAGQCQAASLALVSDSTTHFRLQQIYLGRGHYHCIQVSSLMARQLTPTLQLMRSRLHV